MTLRATVSVLAASLLLCACVIVPRTVDNYDPDCQLVTHHMELQTVQIGPINNCSYKQDCVAIVAALGVTAASAIVSGSIVVIGNVVYWAEQRAGCVAPGKPFGPATTSL
jgi:predicted small integral membrane protein